MAPSTSADEQLVLDIVKFLAAVIKCRDSDSSAVNETYNWIGEMLVNNSGALYHLLTKTDLSADSCDGKPSNVPTNRYLVAVIGQWQLAD